MLSRKVMWQIPPDNVVLKDDEVHVWCASLDIDESLKTSFLSTFSFDETKRADSFRFSKDRLAYIASRGILRCLIGRYLKIEPDEIVFEYGKFGKPSLLGRVSPRFNSSHSSNLGIFAITSRLNVGIDIETIRSDIDLQGIAKRFFSPGEAKALNSLPEEKRTEGFYNCWTRKEAFIKAVGHGLSFPLDQFEVSLDPDEPAEILSSLWNPKGVSKWSLHSFSPGQEFIAALVVQGQNSGIKYFRFDRSNNFCV